MNNVLSWWEWLATAGAAVLLIALGVAWREHRHRIAARRHDPAWVDTEVHFGAPAAAAHLDHSLDHPPGQAGVPLEPRDQEPEQEREQSARQSVLAAALSRMARHKTEPDQRNAWADTQPLANEASAGRAQAVSRSVAE